MIVYLFLEKLENDKITYNFVTTAEIWIITWYRKRQNTVETSTFGSEIIALRIAVELVEALRYKLQMFEVTMKGPAWIFCDD